MTPLTRASVGLEPTRSGRCPAHITSLSATLPARPDPHGLSVGACHATGQGFPCCVHSPLPCVLPPIPRRNLSVRVSLASRQVAAFPVIRAGRLPHHTRFEACSAFTHVAVAVGKRVTLLPPHRSPHARWGTGLLPRVFHGKTLRRPRVPDLDEWPIQCGNAHDIGDRGSILL